jgi:hypothetical protein
MAHEQSKRVLSQREKRRIENRREDLKDGVSVPFLVQGHTYMNRY